MMKSILIVLLSGSNLIWAFSDSYLLTVNKNLVKNMTELKAADALLEKASALLLNSDKRLTAACRTAMERP